MSNVSSQPTGNLVLSPDWLALAKVGKAFHLIYITFIALVLLLIGCIPVSWLDETSGLFFILLGAGILAWALFGFVVWIIAMVRFWETPESIVPGGGIGRVLVILCVITFLIGIAAGALKEIDSNVSLALQGLGGLLNFASQVVFLVYAWRLASAVGSERVKSCVKWIVYGTLGIFALAFMAGFLSAFPAAAPTGLILLIGFGILGLAILLSWLNLFGYMAKDIQKFIESFTQLYFVNMNQNVENQNE